MSRRAGPASHSGVRARSTPYPQLALAGDHQGRAMAVLPGAAQEGLQHRPGAVLVQAVQVEPRVQRRMFAGDLALAVGLDALQRARLALGFPPA
jgi:hypothetical protein